MNLPSPPKPPPSRPSPEGETFSRFPPRPLVREGVGEAAGRADATLGGLVALDNV